MTGTVRSVVAESYRVCLLPEPGSFDVVQEILEEVACQFRLTFMPFQLELVSVPAKRSAWARFDQQEQLKEFVHDMAGTGAPALELEAPYAEDRHSIPYVAIDPARSLRYFQRDMRLALRVRQEQRYQPGIALSQTALGPVVFEEVQERLNHRFRFPHPMTFRQLGVYFHDSVSKKWDLLLYAPLSS